MNFTHLDEFLSTDLDILQAFASLWCIYCDTSGNSISLDTSPFDTHFVIKYVVDGILLDIGGAICSDRWSRDTDERVQQSRINKCLGLI